MRRQEILKLADWGSDMNLNLCWTDEEHGINDQGFWSTARALLWSRKPCRLLASVYVRNGEYVINTQSDDGLGVDQKRALEKHLKSLNMARKEHDRIPN